MAIDIPKGGFKTLDQATEAISGIMNRPVEALDEPRADDRQPDEPVQTDEHVGEDQNAEPTDQDIEQFRGEGGQDTGEGSDGSEELPEGAREPESTESENEEYEYDYSALAQALGLEEDDLIIDDGKIHVRTKVNGEEGLATLNDLKSSFQMTSAAQKGMQELAQEKKQFTEERKARLQDFNNQLEMLARATEAIEQAYLNDFQNTNWDQLKVEDPDGYTARRMDYQDREKAIVQFKQGYKQMQEQAQQEFYAQMSQVWEEGSKQLNNVFTGPEYKNAPKWDDAEGSRLTKWMIQQGFPAESVSTLGSWQVFKWARDSMLRDEELRKAKKTVKRVVKLPKVKSAKPSTPASNTQNKRSKLDEAKRRQVVATRKGNKNFNESVDLISQLLKS